MILDFIKMKIIDLEFLKIIIRNNVLFTQLYTYTLIHLYHFKRGIYYTYKQ